MASGAENSYRLALINSREEEGEYKRKLERASIIKEHLVNLLARIHRDGGHYTLKHGFKKERRGCRSNHC